jgi:hypothetical protein
MNSPSEELVKMYDRNDVPFYVLTTDPEQKDDVLDDVWTALDKMDGRGEVYVRHRGIVREYATESAFGRSSSSTTSTPILYAFDTRCRPCRHTGAEHARYEARQRIRVHQVRRRRPADTAVV